jgi:5-methylcytosine-specific restriction enzyme subunit McrC
MVTPLPVELIEYQPTRNIALSEAEIAALRKVPGLIISSSGKANLFDLTPGSVVGAVALDHRVFHIRPKIPIDRLFFLLSYSVNPSDWSCELLELKPDASVLEAIIPGFVWHIRRAFVRGLLRGYLPQEAALVGVRGRIRVGEQIRRRLGRFPPVECRFDEFTEDIEENRLIRAAINSLRRLNIRNEAVRRSLLLFEHVLDGVQSVHYDARRLPAVTFTRINRHYQSAVLLSKVILAATSPEFVAGRIPSSAFLVDMNVIFENFVLVALREALGLSEAVFPQGCNGRSLYLDEDRRVNLKPDLSWWHRMGCVFVGDAKYKRVEISGIKHADLYQLLAYTVSARLSDGLLIYAAGEAEAARHVVTELRTQLHVVTLDLCAAPEIILRRVRVIAEQIRQMRIRQISQAG